MKIVHKHGYVMCVDSWGSDQQIVEAARMSTNKGFLGWGTTCLVCGGLGRITTSACNACAGTGVVAGDEKLLRYLMKNGHSSPFEMAGATFEVKVPIFVAREWMRHRTQSYNEMSGRYTELPNEFYLPSRERLIVSQRSKTNKQGSSDGIEDSLAENVAQVIEVNYREARNQYEWMLQRNIAPEIARLVLPVSQYTRFRASANLGNWFKFLHLRTAMNAQSEIRDYANVVADYISELFPRSYSLWKEFDVQHS